MKEQQFKCLTVKNKDDRDDEDGKFEMDDDV